MARNWKLEHIRFKGEPPRQEVSVFSKQTLSKVALHALDVQPPAAKQMTWEAALNLNYIILQ
jgi:hypothetical protein